MPNHHANILLQSLTCWLLPSSLCSSCSSKSSGLGEEGRMRCPKSPLWGLSTSREQMSKQGQECRNPAQATNKHAARLPPPRWMCRAEAVTPFSSWGGCRRRETTQLEASGAGKVPAQHSSTRLQWLLQEGEMLEVSEQMRARFVWRSQSIGPIGGGGRRRSAVCFGLFCVLFYFILFFC